MANIEIQVAINEVTGELLSLLRSLNEEQLNKVPFEGSWSAGQIGDHLLRSYAVVETLNGSTIRTDRPPDQKVEEVRKLFLNFSIKMKSPGFIIPSNAPINKEKLLISLKQRIEQIDDLAKTGDLTVTCLDYAIPEYGEFTRLEWLHFIMVHTQRHVHQLKNVINEQCET